MKKQRSETDAIPLTGSMKMSDLLDLNPNLLGVLTRVGLRFGFGDETIEEACRKKGINLQTFLLICKVYTFAGYTPSSDALRTADLCGIVTYLHQSHSYYMDTALQDLAAQIDRMLAPCNERYKKILWGFFSAYKDELAEHFRYEEEVVFPYVQDILDHVGDKTFTITQYEENHTNVEEKLGDLKNIIMKYLPQECDDRQVSEVLFKLYLLEMDLEKHTAIEDDILVPMVNRLEDHES